MSFLSHHFPQIQTIYLQISQCLHMGQTKQNFSTKIPVSIYQKDFPSVLKASPSENILFTLHFQVTWCTLCSLCLVAYMQVSVFFLVVQMQLIMYHPYELLFIIRENRNLKTFQEGWMFAKPQLWLPWRLGKLLAHLWHSLQWAVSWWRSLQQPFSQRIYWKYRRHLQIERRHFYILDAGTLKYLIR